MDLDNVYIADLETDGFLEEVTKLHVFSVGFKNKDGGYSIKSTKDVSDIKKVMENPNNTVVGHNFYLYDIPVLEKLFNIEVKAAIIDTLFVAWYIDPNRIKEGKKFGLESYGEDFGVPKPEIGSEEWAGLSEEKLKIIEYYEGLDR